MTVTLELKPEILRRVEHRAKENGKPVEDFLEEFIEENISESDGPRVSNVSSDVKRNWKERFHEFLESIEDKDYPHLPDEALRRENIYEDRF
jgi:hypothetical protein